MDSSGNVDARATSTDAGVSTLPTVYASSMPPVDTPPATTPPPSTNIIDWEFLRSADGLLKAIEIVFSLVTFICATVWHDFVPLGGGWVQFVSMIAFILTTFLYMLYMFRLTSKLSEQMPFKFVELCYYCTFTLFYFISGVVSAANAHRDGAVVAAAIFSFFSMAVFGVDIYLRFMAWRHSSEGPYFSSMTSSLGGVTSSTSVASPQY